jgi:hypothetical protein
MSDDNNDDEPRRWDALNGTERQCLRMIRRYRDGREDPELGEAFQFPAASMMLMARKLSDTDPEYPELPNASLEIFKIGARSQVPMLTLPIESLVLGLERMGFLIVPPEQAVESEVETEDEVQA